jgi:hypothetical protein
MAGFSRRRFAAGVAAFAGCSMVGAQAFAHGRKDKAGKGGLTPDAVTESPLPDAAPAPTAATTPASDTAAPANLDTLGRLDPQGLIRKPLLAAAIVALEKHKDRVSDHSRLFITDFSKHSSEARLYRVDMTTGDVTAYRTAHGRGSDPDRSGWARQFSNQPGSYASSVGAYLTLGEGYGLHHGRHIGLDGLDPSNSMAKDRAIIVHSAEYCEIPFLRENGMLGRSEGCFATASKDLAELLPEMGPGRLLYVAA